MRRGLALGGLFAAVVLSSTAHAQPVLGPVTTLASGGAPEDISTATNARGDALVAWESTTKAGGAVIKVARSVGGGPFSAPQVLTPPPQGGRDPTVAMSEDGTAAVQWVVGHTVRGGGISYRAKVAVAPAGFSFGAPETLASQGSIEDGVEIAFGPRDELLAAWPDYANGLSVQSLAVKPAGRAFGPVKRLYSAEHTTAEAPTIAVAASGRATIVWDQGSYGEGTARKTARAYRSIPGAVKMRTLDADGRLGRLRQLSPKRSECGSSSFAQSASGAALVSFTCSGPRTSFGVGMVFRPAGGRFSTPGRLAGSDDYQSVAGIDSAGRGHVVWLRRRRNGTTVVHTGISSQGRPARPRRVTGRIAYGVGLLTVPAGPSLVSFRPRGRRASFEPLDAKGRPGPAFEPIGAADPASLSFAPDRGGALLVWIDQRARPDAVRTRRVTGLD